MLLPTVQSRCPRLRFQSAEHDTIDEDARAIARDVLAQAAATDDPGRRIEAAKDLLAKTGAGGRTDREQLASHLHAMASLLRDAEVLSTHADAGVLANADVRSDLDRLAKAFGGDRGVRAFAAVDTALDALDRNANAIPEYASLAKARAGETVHLATNELVQMHGGIGMTDAHDAGLYMKRARVAEALYGSAAFHRDRYASLLGF